MGVGAYPGFFFGGDTPLKKGVTPINQIFLQNTWSYIRELYVISVGGGGIVCTLFVPSP